MIAQIAANTMGSVFGAAIAPHSAGAFFAWSVILMLGHYGGY
jgi:hypothetical protein